MAKLAAYKHNKRKAREYALKLRGHRGAHDGPKIATHVWRTIEPGIKTEFAANACFVRPQFRRIPGQALFKGGRNCGYGYGNSPTSAIKKALGELAHML